MIEYRFILSTSDSIEYESYIMRHTQEKNIYNIYNPTPLLYLGVFSQFFSSLVRHD